MHKEHEERKQYRLTYSGEKDIESRLDELGFEVVRKLRLVEPPTYFVRYSGESGKRKESFEGLYEIEGLELCVSKDYSVRIEPTENE